MGKVHQDKNRRGNTIRWGAAVCGQLPSPVWCVPNLERDISIENACKRCLTKRKRVSEANRKRPARSAGERKKVNFVTSEIKVIHTISEPRIVLNCTSSRESATAAGASGLSARSGAARRYSKKIEYLKRLNSDSPPHRFRNSLRL